MTFIDKLAIFYSRELLISGMSSTTTSKGKRGLLQPGQERSMPPFSLKGLLPQTEYYITYEGSATMPACQETATWILFNRPIYMTEQQVLIAVLFSLVSMVT